LTVFQKVKNVKVYETVILQLKQKIYCGELGPGDILPPERILADMMGVSRASVREALKILEFMGLIESKPGEGTFITSLHTDLLIEKLNSLSTSENETLLLDLIELREVLEPRIVELAVERATEKELEEIEQSLEELQNDFDETFIVDNITFHLVIARASHNVFFIRLMETMLDMLQETEELTLSFSRQRQKIIEEHRKIAQCIKKRNGKEAIKAIKEHLKIIRRVVEEGYRNK